jgi:hypothetical protein
MSVVGVNITEISNSVWARRLFIALGVKVDIERTANVPDSQSKIH